MKVLVVKTSSMGDIIHTLPALTDAAKKIPEIRFDWVIEEAFSEIPHWHPHVDTVIPIGLRKWRKKPLHMILNGEWQRFYRQLREKNYDLIIDAQGLLKSGVVTLLARGLRSGLDKHSARERFASLCYQKKYSIHSHQHAVDRVRELFSQALGYDYKDEPNFNIQLEPQIPFRKEAYVIFLHSTSWKNKEWPEHYWIELGKIIEKQGYKVLLPWGNSHEYARACRIHSNCFNSELLDKSSLTTLANLLANAKAVISVDTGLGHLAAALNVPTISMYGPTDSKKTGTCGRNQDHIVSSLACAPCLSQECKSRNLSSLFPPCFESMTPQLVWERVKRIIKL